MTDGSSFLRHICSWRHRKNLLNDMVLIDNIQRLNYAHNYSYRVKSFPDKRRLAFSFFFKNVRESTGYGLIISGLGTPDVMRMRTHEIQHSR